MGLYRDNGKGMEATIMENQMEKNMEHEMETGIIIIPKLPAREKFVER